MTDTVLQHTATTFDTLLSIVAGVVVVPRHCISNKHQGQSLDLFMPARELRFYILICCACGKPWFQKSSRRRAKAHFQIL